MDNKRLILLVIIIAIITSMRTSIHAMGYSEAQSAFLIKKYTLETSPEHDYGSEGERSLSVNTICTLSISRGVEITGISSDMIKSYEILSSKNNQSVGYFVDEYDFVSALLSMNGDH